MKIAVFGGSFDPPHIGHRAIADHLLTHKLADQVWFLPVKHHAFGKQVTADLHRLAMLELLINTQPDMKINTTELEQQGMSITYYTLQQLQRKHPQHTFTFIMGADNIAKFDQWHSYPELLSEFGVLVYPRQGFSDAQLMPGMQYISDMEPVVASSTEIKAQFSKHQNPQHLLTPPVYDYIVAHGLYVS